MNSPSNPLENTVRRCRERNIIIPTYEEMAHPEMIPDGIRDEFQSTNPAAESLKMGWGITTGSVTMSHYGSRASDLALVGDCTNLAFRLSGIANKDLDKKIILCAMSKTNTMDQ